MASFASPNNGAGLTAGGDLVAVEHPDWIPEHAGLRVVQAKPEVAGGQLRVGQQVRDRVDRDDDQVAPLSFMEQVLAGEPRGEVDDEGSNDVVVRGAVLISALVGLVENLLVPGYFVDPLGQGVPLPGGDDTGGYPTVLAGVSAQRDYQRGSGPDSGHVLLHLHPGERRVGVGVIGDERFLQRHVDVLALAAVHVPVVKSAQNRSSGELGPGKVGLIVALPHRRAVGLAGDLHEAAGSQGDQVRRAVVLPRARLAERRDGRHHQPRVSGAEFIVAEAQRLEAPNRVAFHHHVGPRGQLLEQRPSPFVFQVQGYGALVGVVEEEVEAALGPGLIAGERSPGAAWVSRRRLHPDDVGPVVGQQLSAKYPLRAAQVQDPVRRQEGAFPWGLWWHRTPRAGLFDARPRPVRPTISPGL